MIRYSVTFAELEQLVAARAEHPRWMERAAQRTKEFRDKGQYEESSSIWSEVKQIYMDVQQAKCIYCERKLESTGKVEWDVEHFRPKGRVRKWKDQDAGESSIPGGAASPTGYYLLPYHLLNYLASCKVCNSTYKSDYFPVRGERRLDMDDPRQPHGEKPLLLYPLGDIDENPEEIITFQGYLSVPAQTTGEKRERGLVTISFFGLNVRDTLLVARAEMIVALYDLLRFAPHGEAVAFMKRAIASGKSVHANCGRAFLATFEHDDALAEIYAQKAAQYLRSVGR